MEEVPRIEPTEKPLSELPAREHLGTLIKRFRLKASKTTAELAAATNIDERLLERAESFEVPLDASQLQNLAAFLGVQWHPLLDAARAFHRAVWASDNEGKGGVQLESMETKIKSLHGPLDPEAEALLVKAADDMLFFSNVMRDAADRALTNVVQIRAMLSDRGVIPPDQALELLDNPKVPCAACGVTLDRNLESTVSFVPDGGGETLHFASKDCAERWRGGEAFICERSGLPVVQTSAQDGETRGEG